MEVRAGAGGSATINGRQWESTGAAINKSQVTGGRRMAGLIKEGFEFTVSWAFSRKIP